MFRMFNIFFKKKEKWKFLNHKQFFGNKEKWKFLNHKQFSKCLNMLKAIQLHLKKVISNL